MNKSSIATLREIVQHPHRRLNLRGVHLFLWQACFRRSGMINDDERALMLTLKVTRPEGPRHLEKTTGQGSWNFELMNIKRETS